MDSDPMLKPGTNFCKCSACGRYFGGDSGFSRHRVKGAGRDRSCLDPSVIADKEGRTLFRLNDRGYWVRNYGS